MANAFIPVRGTEIAIQNIPITEGQVYFAYDSGRIFMDKGGLRYVMGSSAGSSFVYADGTDAEITKDTEDTNDSSYTIKITALEDPSVYPKEGVMIINSDGRFFRVISTDPTNENIHTVLIAVSGSGDGTGGGSVSAIKDLDLVINSGLGRAQTYIFGKEYFTELTPYAMGDNPDTLLDVIYEVEDLQHNTEKQTFLYHVESGTPHNFNTALLPESTNLRLTIRVDSSNSQMRAGSKPTRVFDNIKVVAMGINKVASYNATTITQGERTLSFIPYGEGLREISIHVEIDGIEINSGLTPTSYNGNSEVTITLPAQPHGVHTVSVYASTSVNNIELNSDPITYELAWREEGETSPVLWIGDYQKTVINYESATIPFMVYDPVAESNAETTPVQLQINGETVANLEVRYNATQWITWDIVNYNVGDNICSISSGTASKTFTFNVTTEGSRDLGLVNEGALLLNLSSSGRSNLENISKRNQWTYGNFRTEFTNFNWYNNGWRNDEDNMGAYLSVANGAKLKINFQPLTMNSTEDYSFELRFRIRNVQEYSTLIRLIPKYFIDKTLNPETTFESYTLDDIKTNGYTILYDEDGNPRMDEVNSIKEAINDKGVCFKYLDNSGYGICIGTQEAYFKAPSGIANVRYKEDEIINISFIVSRTNKLLSIYLNGILSGVVDLSTSSGFNIENGYFEVNSEYCDIDLYKLRVYRRELSMPDVIHNYLSDIHSIILYDQNQLTDISNPTRLMYDKLIAYNEEHPEALSMPYAVWEVIDNRFLNDPNGGGHGIEEDQLPYFKGNDRYVKITFINPALDKAWKDGIVTETQYLASSPSYVAVGVSINVQGTSSQAYPRRNYKTKFKSATKTAPEGWIDSDDYKWGWYYLGGPRDGEPVDSWHMDNVNCSTNKFTWKIDYMESSGSYNTGFANLVGNGIYNGHPLSYYEDFTNKGIGYRTSVYGFPVLVFHKHSTSRDVAKFGTDDEKDVYQYIGRYNLNLDKSSNEYYGFELSSEQPYVTKSDSSHPSIASVAECWEFRDNQGTWTSFKFPTDDAREVGFAYTDTESKLEVVKHFEARYHYDGDAIEKACEYNPTEADTAVKLGDKTTVDLSNQTNINTFLTEKYKNLEIVFRWLDSTDTTVVPQTDTGTPLETPQTYQQETKYMVAAFDKLDVNEQPVLDSMGRKVSELWFVNIDGEKVLLVNEANTDSQGFIIDSNDIRLTSIIAADNYVGQVKGYNTQITYQTDCAGYRLNKFKAEFNQHLNLDYCVDYFILTELLLCYDSRGKNMMFASWGPKEVGGEYIWFPIFYDIDTQLGLNNIGAVLWDYDADATIDGDFSTARSVLWTNLFSAFRSTIEARYRKLRSDSKLTEKSIEGAYLCDPEVFTNSYAMKGIRPIVAIGLDEYYKYIAPSIPLVGNTTDSDYDYKNRYNGFYNTSGRKETTKGYVYTCQGDRKLSRSLFIRNRLNYLDSWWLAGQYTPEQVKDGIMIRANANDVNTSDKFLDESIVSSVPSNSYTLTQYPKPYFDATPQFEITPFLAQYVTVFYDEDPIIPSKKYNGIDPVITNTTPSVENGYRAIAPYNEQLTYIPGGDFLSSLGDLSLKYPSHFTLSTGKRLTDVTLGSDIPGYVNNLLGAGEGTFNLNDGLDSSNKKGLLEKIILTGLGRLSGAIDVQGSEKLQEFRALGTAIQYPLFADGSPLHTIHLPSTTTQLNLVEAKNMTNIITSRPTVMNENDGVYTYKSSDNYKGLYIEGVTDSNSSTNTMKLEKINIVGDAFGYDSYKLLSKAVAIKQKMIGVEGQGQTLAINLKDVYWCPYTKIDEDALYNSSITYYKLTDHNTFEVLDYSQESSNWNSLALNGKIFTYDPNTDESIISDLELLNIFINDYNNAKAINSLQSNHYRTGDRDAVEITLPNITGTIYVSNKNGTAINEADIPNVYGKYFKNLTIYAGKVNPSYLTKYIHRDFQGKDNEIDILRDAISEGIKPRITTKVPTQDHYDFQGWALEPTGESMVLLYNNDGSYTSTELFNDLLFSSEQTSYTFYAIFILHSYEFRFKNKYDDYEEDLDVRTMPYSATVPGIPETNRVPSRPYPLGDNQLDNRGNQGLYRTYKFMGWARSTRPDTVVDLSKIFPISDMTFVPVYRDVNVYDNVLDDKYLIFERIGTGSSVSGCSVKLNPDYYLQGKVTLPLTGKIEGISQRVPITVISTQGFGAQSEGNLAHEITHIFWEKGTHHLDTIRAQAFQWSIYLKYYEQQTTCTTLEQSVFENCIVLGASDLDGSMINNILKPVTTIHHNIFNGCDSIKIFNIPGNAFYFPKGGPFFGVRNATSCTLGAPDDPTRILEKNKDASTGEYLSTFNSIFGMLGYYVYNQAVSFRIYTTNPDSPEWDTVIANYFNLPSETTWNIEKIQANG